MPSHNHRKHNRKGRRGDIDVEGKQVARWISVKIRRPDIGLVKRIESSTAGLTEEENRDEGSHGMGDGVEECDCSSSFFGWLAQRLLSISI